MALLLVLTASVFLPCLFNDYVYDDYRFIKDNPFMSGALDLQAIFTDPETMESGYSHDIYRPIRTLFFYLEHQLGGEKPLLHHLIGLLIHLVNTCLVAKLITMLLINDANANVKSGSFAVVLGSGFFALHPVQVESVAWITSRGDQLSAMFVFLVLICALSRPMKAFRFNYLLTAALTLLACFSKESGVIAGALILVAWFSFQRFKNRSVLIHGSLAIAAALIYLGVRSAFLGKLQGQVQLFDGNIIDRIIYASFGQIYQASLLIKPFFSNVDYSYPFFEDYSFKTFGLLGILYPIMLFTAIKLIKRQPVVGFAILFYFAAQIPTSSFIFPLQSLVNDRYLYLPILGAALLLSKCILVASSTNEKSAKTVKIAGLLILLSISCYSFLRTFEWSNEEILWTATRKTNPKSVQACIGLCNAYYDKGEYDKALDMAKQAIFTSQPGSPTRTIAALQASDVYEKMAEASTDPNTKKEMNDLAALTLGNALSEAERLGKALDSMPTLIDGAKKLWKLETQRNQYQVAIWAASILLRYGGETAEHHLLLGLSYMHNRNFDLAEKQLLKGSLIDGRSSMNHFALSELYRYLGREAKALEEQQKGLDLQKIEKLK